MGLDEEDPLHASAGDDGANPYNGVIFDNAGNLYGTTALGGNLALHGAYGCGTVFQLTPSADPAGQRMFSTVSKVEATEVVPSPV